MRGVRECECEQGGAGAGKKFKVESKIEYWADFLTADNADNADGKNMVTGRMPVLPVREDAAGLRFSFEHFIAAGGEILLTKRDTARAFVEKFRGEKVRRAMRVAEVRREVVTRAREIKRGLAKL